MDEPSASVEEMGMRVGMEPLESVGDGGTVGVCVLGGVESGTDTCASEAGEVGV